LLLFEPQLGVLVEVAAQRREDALHLRLERGGIHGDDGGGEGGHGGGRRLRESYGQTRYRSKQEPGGEALRPPPTRVWKARRIRLRPQSSAGPGAHAAWNTSSRRSAASRATTSGSRRVSS